MKAGQQLGKYQLLQPLGRGGMAEVWKALDTQLQREVAIKVMRADLQSDPDFMSHFRQEAQIVAALNHPNIVKIYDFSTSDSAEGPFAYMVMEYIEGQTLASYIANTSRKRNFPSPTDIVRLFTAISQAIDYAHQRGLLHRDLKPSNILLNSHNTLRCSMGEPMITDFGIAKLASSSTGALTRRSIGTPYYMSPEQAQGRTGDQRSDLYSLGIILYEICTGVVPFKGENELSILMQHMHETPTNPSLINPQISPALSLVILRTLSKDPVMRFPSASSLTASLAEAFNLPIPPELNLPAFPPDNKEVATPDRYASLSGFPTLRASSPGIATSNPADAATYLIPQSQQGAPVAAAAVSQVATSGPPTPTPIPGALVNTPAVQPAKPPTPSQRKIPPLLMIELGVLVLILILASFSAFALFSHPTTKTGAGTAASTAFSGQAEIVSSGMMDLTQTNSPGLDDEVAISMQNVPPPPNGKVYVAWLLSNQEMAPIPLGKLTVQNGQVHLLYPGDKQHTNLLANYSNFLITIEDPNHIQQVPTAGQGVYHAAFPAIQKDATGFTIYQHLQHLASNDPDLEKLNLHGGLNVWLISGTVKVWGWATSSQSYWNGAQTTLGAGGQAAFIQGQAVHILDVLDGVNNVGFDLPAGVNADQRDLHIAQVGILAPNGNNATTSANLTLGYLDHILFHLNSIANAPGVTTELQQQIAPLPQEIARVRGWLSQVRADAKQIAAIDPNSPQYQQASTLVLLNDMAINADYALNGQINPTTGQLQYPGIRQISASIQGLVTFHLKPCQGASCANA
jgi:serine/threonine protein kinase